jgi:hypothetical protein
VGGKPPRLPHPRTYVGGVKGGNLHPRLFYAGGVSVRIFWLRGCIYFSAGEWIGRSKRELKTSAGVHFSARPPTAGGMPPRVNTSHLFSVSKSSRGLGQISPLLVVVPDPTPGPLARALTAVVYRLAMSLALGSTAGDVAA